MTTQECYELANEIEQKFEGVECWYEPQGNIFGLWTDNKGVIRIPAAYYQALWGFATLIQP